MSKGCKRPLHRQLTPTHDNIRIGLTGYVGPWCLDDGAWVLWEIIRISKKYIGNIRNYKNTYIYIYMYIENKDI